MTAAFFRFRSSQPQSSAAYRGVRQPPLIRVLIIILLLLAAGCANETGSKNSGVLTVATVRDMVLIGHSRTLGTTGSFEIQSVYGAPMSCEGRFRYPRPPDGTAYFNCSDGQQGSVRIKADGVLTGQGRGNSDMGSIHVVYGYSIDQMNRKLDLPSGMKLVHDERGIGLVEVPGNRSE